MTVYEIFSRLDEEWSEKYKRSINCASPKGFSQKAHCAGRKKNESMDTNVTNKFVKKFLPWLQKELDIKQLPKIELLDQPMTTSFGSYDSENNCLYVLLLEDIQWMCYVLWHTNSLITNKIWPAY